MRKSTLFVKVLLLIALVSVFFSACQKEYSYEGGIPNVTVTGTAVYTLNGAGGNCAGSNISGTYYESIKLTPGNMVQLSVNVTTVGTYSLATNFAGGISFSGSGTFTVTGPQTITLVGSGTPSSTGSFTFTPPVGAGCSFAVNIAKRPPPMAAFTLQGSPGRCTNAIINGSYNPGGAMISTNNVVIYVNVTETGDYLIKTDTLDGISFSDSGKFTSTGNQMVTLAGTGIPELARNLTFTPSSSLGAGCTFNLSVVDNGILATYVLESGFGTTSPCIYTLAGAYTANTPLDNSNSVDIRVYVSVAGNFTVATTTVDGMEFSYSGTFTTTGTQYVTLAGSGTPVAKGIYTLVPQIVGPHPLGGEICGIEVAVN
ncbi:MAG: hypothetical protein ABI416_05530 [Ginsengibacter sp.]